MSCNKITNTCPDSTNARCVDYEGNIPEISKLYEQGCINTHETTEDTYELVEKLYDQIDMSELGNDCIEYPLPKYAKTVVKVLEEKVCSLIGRVDTLEDTHICDIDITGCNFDFGELVDPCGDPITTLGQLLQIIINELQQ